MAGMTKLYLYIFMFFSIGLGIPMFVMESESVLPVIVGSVTMVVAAVGLIKIIISLAEGDYEDAPMYHPVLSMICSILIILIEAFVFFVEPDILDNVSFIVPIIVLLVVLSAIQIFPMFARFTCDIDISTTKAIEVTYEEDREIKRRNVNLKCGTKIVFLISIFMVILAIVSIVPLMAVFFVGYNLYIIKEEQEKYGLSTTILVMTCTIYAMLATVFIVGLGEEDIFLAGILGTGPMGLILALQIALIIEGKVDSLENVLVWVFMFTGGLGLILGVPMAVGLIVTGIIGSEIALLVFLGIELLAGIITSIVLHVRG